MVQEKINHDALAPQPKTSNMIGIATVANIPIPLYTATFVNTGKELAPQMTKPRRELTISIVMLNRPTLDLLLVKVDGRFLRPLNVPVPVGSFPVLDIRMAQQDTDAPLGCPPRTGAGFFIDLHLQLTRQVDNTRNRVKTFLRWYSRVIGSRGIKPSTGQREDAREEPERRRENRVEERFGEDTPCEDDDDPHSHFDHRENPPDADVCPGFVRASGLGCYEEGVADAVVEGEPAADEDAHPH
jgi:hypothetical protein